MTPYGYGATITAVIDHPVLGIDDEEKALDFLLDHNVIYNRPTVPEMGNQEERKRQQSWQMRHMKIWRNRCGIICELPIRRLNITRIRSNRNSWEMSTW